jgi:hypothetical protein
MTRLHSRPLALALGTLALGLAATAARGQTGSIDLKPYRMDAKQITGDMSVKLQEMKNAKRRVQGPEVNANRQMLKQVAQFYVYKVTQDQYYTGGDTGELKPRTGDLSLDVAFDDLEKTLLIPKPGEPLTLDQVDYIREYGAALDQAVVAVLTDKGGPPAVIRINAARMLAQAARTGAPAHAKTITALLTNQFYKGKDGKPAETPPDVLLWALKAAENLLAAPDPTAISLPNPARHTLKNEELVPLVQALDNMVLHNPPVADKAADLNPQLAIKPPPPPSTTPGAAPPAEQPAAPQQGGKLDPNALTAEQVGLIRFYRRQAIRALAKVRFDTVGGDGTPEVRCGYTLMKVAVNDATINPGPSVAEVGEAVIGLCGINPSQNLNVDFLLNATAYGTDLFFSQKVGNPQDKLLPWKLYAARIGQAYEQMQKNAQVNPRLSPFRQQITALAGIVSADLVVPIEKGDETSPPRTERLTQWMQNNQAKDGLYGDDKQQKYKLAPRPRQ